MSRRRLRAGVTPILYQRPYNRDLHAAYKVAKLREVPELLKILGGG